MLYLLFIIILLIEERIEYWSDEENQRTFFEKFAFEMKFDSKDPKNWYSVSDKIKKRKVHFLLFFFFNFNSLIVYFD